MTGGLKIEFMSTWGSESSGEARLDTNQYKTGHPECINEE